MRILVLEPAACDQHAGFDNRPDHRFVGVALFTLVVQHAPAGQAGRLLGETAIGVDRIRNGCIDAARGKLARVGGPNIEVLTPVSWRGMDEAGARVFGDMIAGKERDFKIVAFVEALEWMLT